MGFHETRHLDSSTVLTCLISLHVFCEKYWQGRWISSRRAQFPPVGSLQCGRCRGRWPTWRGRQPSLPGDFTSSYAVISVGDFASSYAVISAGDFASSHVVISAVQFSSAALYCVTVGLFLSQVVLHLREPGLQSRQKPEICQEALKIQVSGLILLSQHLCFSTFLVFLIACIYRFFLFCFVFFRPCWVFLAGHGLALAAGLALVAVCGRLTAVASLLAEPRA